MSLLSGKTDHLLGVQVSVQMFRDLELSEELMSVLYYSCLESESPESDLALCKMQRNVAQYFCAELLTYSLRKSLRKSKPES